MTPTAFLALARQVETAAGAAGLLVDGERRRLAPASGAAGAPSSPAALAEAVLTAADALRQHLLRSSAVLGAPPGAEDDAGKT